MIFNTHSHLNDDSFIEIEEAIIEECYEKNITLLVVGYNIEMSRKAILLAEKYSNVYASVGIHPTEANNYLEDLIVIEEMMTHPKVVAIGETGLDYHWDTCPKDIQKKSFVKQIELAKKYRKPVIVHMRDAALDTLEIVREVKLDGIGGIMHCYSGSAEMVMDYVNEGMHISLGGPVTFKNAKVPKEVAKVVPIDRLLVETDDPWLSPTPYRGKQNKAHYVTYIVDEIAKLREEKFDYIAEKTYRNALKLFKLQEDN